MNALHTPEILQPARTVIIALGKNIGIGSSPEDIRNDPWSLSDESRLTAIAAGQLWLDNQALGIETDILFSSGETTTGIGANGEEVPSEAKAMAEYMLHRFRGEDLQPLIPRSRILLQTRSIDTAGDAIQDAAILNALEEHVGPAYEETILLTVGYHTKRAKGVFERTGVPISRTVKSENVVRGIADHAHLVRHRNRNLRVRAEGVKEFIGRCVMRTPLGTKMLSSVTEKSRG